MLYAGEWMEYRSFVPKNRCFMREDRWRIGILCQRIDAYAGGSMENRSFLPENRCFTLENGYSTDLLCQRIDALCWRIVGE